MAHEEEEDRLQPLRAAMHQPDRRTWRRHLARPARAAGRRPPEGRLVTSLWWDEDASPAADLGDGGTRTALGRRTGDEPRPTPRLALWQVVAAVLMLAGGVVLASGWLPADRPGPPGDEAVVGPANEAIDPVGDVSSEHAAAPPAGGASGGTPAVRLWPAADVQVTGREVRTDGGRWEVGDDGDVITVGDWDCDRLPTPAVLRPSTGRVAVFDAWATDGTTMPARAVAAVPGAVAVEASTTCGEIVVRSADGAEQVVATTTDGGS